MSEHRTVFVKKLNGTGKEERALQLKAAAQVIIDRAEEIIGENVMCKGRTVTIKMEPNRPPVITWATETTVNTFEPEMNKVEWWNNGT